MASDIVITMLPNSPQVEEVVTGHQGILEGARPMHPASLLREAGADVYSPHWGATDPQVVSEVHAAGGAVAVWPVDDEAAIAWCNYCKPDAIFSNRPKEILAALRV